MEANSTEESTSSTMPEVPQDPTNDAVSQQTIEDQPSIENEMDISRNAESDVDMEKVVSDIGLQDKVAPAAESEIAKVEVDSPIRKADLSTECGAAKKPKEEPAVKPTTHPITPVDEELYQLKWLEWKGEQTPIVTQNINGPCPLIAIVNVLLLARKIKIPDGRHCVTAKQLIDFVGNLIVEQSPKEGESEEFTLNYEQNIQDGFDVIEKLTTGIDVNVKFGSVSDFEFTRECIVFDLLQIGLYHGWLVEPQDETTLRAINGLSYNQLVEKMITSRDKLEPEAQREGLAIEEFLNSTASQLTHHGLCELTESVQEEELCVLFRNNHFSTLYKYRNRLYLLVTDQGYLTEPAVAWEALTNIDGDTQFVNPEFKAIKIEHDRPLLPGPSVPPSTTTPVHVPSTPVQNQHLVPAEASKVEDKVESNNKDLTQEEKDHLLALQLQQEFGQPTAHTVDSDLDLARRLQAEENQLQQEQQQQQQNQRQQQPRQQPQRPQQQQRQQLNQQQLQQAFEQQQREQQQQQHSDDGEKKNCVIS